jgi:predicted RNA binding protein YcfA (HicA-like mRNA interferase family)
MSKWTKLHETLARNPEQRIRFTELVGLLEAFGFVHKRTKGSHRSFKHSDVPLVLTVQPRGKEAVPKQVKQLLEVVREYGLHIEA